MWAQDNFIRTKNILGSSGNPEKTVLTIKLISSSSILMWSGVVDKLVLGLKPLGILSHSFSLSGSTSIPRLICIDLFVISIHPRPGIGRRYRSCLELKTKTRTWKFSAQCVLCLWVGKWRHFWWWAVGELNELCRQARPTSYLSTMPMR